MQPATREPLTPGSDDAATRGSNLMVAAAIAGFLLVAIAFLARTDPLTGDEPLYSLRALSFANRNPLWFSWPGIRAPGLPFLLTPLVSTSTAATDLRLRLLVVVAGAGCIWLVHLIARRVMSRRAAAWSALFFAAVPGMLVSSVYVVPDVPGLLFALLAIYGLLRYLEEGAGAGWLGVVVAATLVANVVRFSEAVVVGCAFVAMIVAWPTIWAARRTRVALTGGLLLLVVVIGNFAPAPGSTTGQSPFVANREWNAEKAQPLGRRPVTFADTGSLSFGLTRRANPVGLGGLVFLGLTLAGLAFVVMAARAAPARALLFPLVWLGLGLGFFFVTLNHFEVRYLSPLFPPAAMLVGSGLAALGTRFSNRRASVVLAAAVLLSGLSFGWYLVSDVLVASNVEDVVAREVGETVAQSAPNCAIESPGPKETEVIWYSACVRRVGDPVPTFSAVWRDTSAAPTPPAGSTLVLARDYVVTSEGQPAHRSVDLYRLG